MLMLLDPVARERDPLGPLTAEPVVTLESPLAPTLASLEKSFTEPDPVEIPTPVEMLISPPAP